MTVVCVAGAAWLLERPASCLQSALTKCLLERPVLTTTPQALVIYHPRNGENAGFLDGNQQFQQTGSLA